MKYLRSFKYNAKSEEVMITLRETRSGDHVDTISMKCSEPPKAPLIQALEALKPHMMQFAELPEDWADAITVRGITVGDKGGRMTVAIRGVRDLEDSNTPLSINTPLHVREKMDDENDSEVEKGTFAEDCYEAVRRLERLAIEYVNGDRQQLVLFKQTDAETPDPEVDVDDDEAMEAPL
jgi:hypothetical protein